MGIEMRMYSSCLWTLHFKFGTARRIRILAGITLLLGFHSLALEAGKKSDPSVAFAVASVHFEQNATDGDVEVVFEAKGGDDGLAKLTVVSPDGRTVIDFTAPDASTLGIRQFHFESPEPGDVESLKSAYPEGVYTFTAASAAGEEFHSESTLSHTLPPPASVLGPGDGAEGVGTRDLEITWRPVPNLAAYIIEVSQDELDVSITVKLPRAVTTFAVPDGFLLPGTEYKIGIGTMTDEGNISFVETSFTTAENALTP